MPFGIMFNGGYIRACFTFENMHMAFQLRQTFVYSSVLVMRCVISQRDGYLANVKDVPVQM